MVRGRHRETMRKSTLLMMSYFMWDRIMPIPSIGICRGFRSLGTLSRRQRRMEHFGNRCVPTGTPCGSTRDGRNSIGVRWLKARSRQGVGRHRARLLLAEDEYSVAGHKGAYRATTLAARALPSEGVGA